MTNTEQIVKEITERKREFCQLSDNSERIIFGIITALENVNVEIVLERVKCECVGLEKTMEKYEERFSELYREYFDKLKLYGDNDISYTQARELKRIHVEAETFELKYYEKDGDLELFEEIRQILEKYV